MKLQVSFFLGLFILLNVGCKTQDSVIEHEVTTTDRLIILLKEDTSPKTLLKSFSELTLISRSNRTLNEWLFEFSTTAQKRDEFLNRLGQSPHVQSVNFNK